MDSIFVPLASATGASLDQIKLITCLLVSYPLGSLFIRIPSSRPEWKHAFNIAIAFLYFIPVLNLWNGSLQLLFSVIGTWLIADNMKTPMMPWTVFAFVMGHLTLNHVIRAIYGLSYETFEVTGPQMVLTMKLTTFAWNVWDGRRPVEELDNWQKEKRVVQYPSLLTFLGYAFYFPGVLVGPYLEYAEYMKLVDGSLFKLTDKADAQSKSWFSGRRMVPNGRKRVAYWKMLMGLIFLGLFVVFGGNSSFSASLSDKFMKKNLLTRIAVFQFYGFIERTKYYAIWTLTEGAAILTGLGFTGYSTSGASKWEGAANVRVWSIEFSPNFKVLLDSWNMKTNVWLRECVYKRVTPKGKKPGFRSSMITFATSAFWHGIAGGYYLTFIFGGFIQTVARLCRSHLRPLFLPANYVASRTASPPPQTPLKRVYDVLGTVSSTMILNYVAAPFILSTISDSMIAWRRLGWYGNWMIGVAIVFFYGGGTRFLRRLQADRVKKAGIEVTKKDDGKTSGSATPLVQVPPLDDVAQQLEKADFMAKMRD